MEVSRCFARAIGVDSLYFIPHGMPQSSGVFNPSLLFPPSPSYTSPYTMPDLSMLFPRALTPPIADGTLLVYQKLDSSLLAHLQTIFEVRLHQPFSCS